jgi:hypothetical protein
MAKTPDGFWEWWVGPLWVLVAHIPGPLQTTLFSLSRFPRRWGFTVQIMTIYLCLQWRPRTPTEDEPRIR